MVSYLFAVPAANWAEFPFLSQSFAYPAVGMNIYSIMGDTVGLLMLPIVWTVFFKKELLAHTSGQGLETHPKELSQMTNLLLCTAAANLFISGMFVAVNDEYLIDVRMVVIFLSVLLYLSYIAENAAQKSLHIRIFAVAAVITIIIMLPTSLNIRGTLLQFNPFNIALKNVFEFWS